MSDFRTITQALLYGWQIKWVLLVEGCPYAFIEENAAGAAAPGGYTFVEGLVVDESNRIGSVVDAQTGIGRSFDLTVTIRRNATTQAAFAKPSNITYLTADLAWNEAATVNVNDTTGFAEAGAIYIGRERIEYTGKTGTTFTTLTRGTPGSPDWPGYDVDIYSGISTWVTDAPYFWRGRRARLYAAPVDPYGTMRANFARAAWQGTIWDKPRGNADGWTLQCRALDRRLDDPIASPVSGKGRWTLEADPRISADPEFCLKVGLSYLSGAGTYDNWLDVFAHDVTLPPPAKGDPVFLSSVRENMVNNWFTLVGTYTPGSDPAIHIGADAQWLHTGDVIDEGKVTRYWEFAYIGRSSALAGQVNVAVVPTWGSVDAEDSELWAAFRSKGDFVPSAGWMSTVAQNFGIPASPLSNWVRTGLFCSAEAGLGALEITIDKGDPTTLPNSGFVVVEMGDETAVYEYDSINVDDGGIVRVHIVPGTGPSISGLSESTIEEAYGEVSVSFAFRANGTAVDVMRQLLESSGRGDNGTFDTLPAGAGLDLREVDEASFPTVIDGAWANVQLDVLTDADASFVDVFGNLLALSGRGLVTKYDSTDTPTIARIAPVYLGLGDSADVTATVTDAELAVIGGSRPVREVRRRRDPNIVTVSIKNQAKARQGTVTALDRVASRAEGPERWSLSAYGWKRSDIAPSVITWADSLFGGRRDVLVFELDVVPWVDCEPGDVIDINSGHFRLWDASTGARGYVGPARVLGVQRSPKSYLTTLTVAIGGTWATHTLAPSMEILGFTGAPPGIGDTVTVAGDYFALCDAYLTSTNPFRLILYQASLDVAAGTGYDFDAVQLSGGNTVLTINALVGAPNPSVGYYLTIPTSGTANAAQLRHTHTDTDAIWR